MKKSASMPSKGLNAQEAFKASVDMPPVFSMRKKIQDPADKEKRPTCQTYSIGNMSKDGAMTMPSWTMLARGSGIPAPNGFPGPGHYPMPGTIYGSHPCLTTPGRVPKTSVKRVGMAKVGAENDPSPQDYKVASFDGEFGSYNQAKAPKFSIRSKIKDPTSKEKRPSCQTYSIGNLGPKGPMIAPSYSMGARSAGIPPPPNVPAPGEYPIPGSIYGAHPCLNTPGRVPRLTEERWPDSKKLERPY